MNSASDEVNKWYEALKEQRLGENEKSAGIWSKYKSDLQVTKSLLATLPKKVSHNVMVPVGPLALMRGKIVHTNEFLVNLGETWFVKRTASQTDEICNRRIKTCEEMLEKLEKERQLIVSKSTLPSEQEAFGNEERPEIIEYVTEEENEEWKKQHRIKEKEYRLQLAELRNKERKPIETEEDLWKHLDELELQEELEDELNRLNEECPSEEDESDENSSELGSVQGTKSTSSGFVSDKSEDKTVPTNSESHSKPKRKISFLENVAGSSSDDEPLRLEIRHSDVECVKTENSGDSNINSPSDIYERYKQNLRRKSLLKNPVNPNQKKELEKLKDLQSSSESEDELPVDTEKGVKTSIQFNDVVERKPFSAPNVSVVDNPKKISKFKAARQKKN